VKQILYAMQFRRFFLWFGIVVAALGLRGPAAAQPVHEFTHYVGGATTPAEFKIDYLGSPLPTTVEFSASAPWISLSVSSCTSACALVVGVKPEGLTEGSYEGLVTMLATVSGLVLKPITLAYVRLRVIDERPRARIVEPVDGSALSSAEVTLRWDGAGAEQFLLAVGSERGGTDLANLNLEQNLGTSVRLPVDGRRIYARLSSRYGAEWRTSDHSYTAFTAPRFAAEILSPPNGSPLVAAEATFRWSDGGADQYCLFVGTAAGASDVAALDAGTRREAVVSGLPPDGRKLYVRLSSRLGTAWKWLDYAYNLAEGETAAAEMIEPIEGAQLGQPPVVFRWTNPPGAAQYFLAVGSEAGGHDIAQADQETRLEASIADLPRDGRRIYVRLSTRFGEEWRQRDYTFIAPK